MLDGKDAPSRDVASRKPRYMVSVCPFAKGRGLSLSWLHDVAK